MERGTEIGRRRTTNLCSISRRSPGRSDYEQDWAGKTLKELAAAEFARRGFLKKIVRAGQQMPFTAETRLDRGDLLSLVGAKHDVERAAKELGYADRATVSTDMIFVALASSSEGWWGCSRSR